MYGRYLPRRPHRVLVLGSGALQIGQAGEFDYSGSQALKALREEGIFTIVVNPNIATVQTNGDVADRVYLCPLTTEVVSEILEREHVDGILLAFGGQTALNCGLALHDTGVLDRYGVRVLGTPIEVIRDTEDRELFVRRLREVDVNTPRSIACRTVAEAVSAASAIGFPVMLRAGFALGGKGSGIVENSQRLEVALKRAFSGSASQVLVEECLRGWKEIEYEIVRDCNDNCISVCNMENVDPLGIHTGESIVVAPSQTLDDTEYQLLRSVAIRTIRHLGVIGECNIQYALDPASREYRVIEVNARLSRSSALASKATGYPLAYVAAKLALGYSLSDIPNGITCRTTAFFEPSLDYIVCKVPRWDLTKFHGAVKQIGSEMKSVGEVMAIGRNFGETLQKALRMLDIGIHGLEPNAFEFEDLRQELKEATPRRIFAIARSLSEGMTVDEVHEITKIDRWFLDALRPVIELRAALSGRNLSNESALLRQAKQLGFSDKAIDQITGEPAGTTRALRHAADIRPHLAQIDTTAAEFPAETNYLYMTYNAIGSDPPVSPRKKIVILGSGVYRIGSSVEFDWCCVSAAKAAAELGYHTIMVNYNPETVSTDYDTCDQLVFDEISFETVLELCEREQPEGVVVSMGGQIANNLAWQLDWAGVRVLGTAPTQIDRAEDRSKFSRLLDDLGIDQPRWVHLTDADDAEAAVARLGGFPVLVRPSYVLSGAAMSVAHEPVELQRILGRAKRVSPDHPVVVSKFETHAREFEIDAVADQGQVVVSAISEHIENAGIHSGDATLMLPPQYMHVSTMLRMRRVAAQLAHALEITGPFNVQFLAKKHAVKVIECNLRASRSFPFVSKTLGYNFAEEAMRRILGARRAVAVESVDLNHVGVKAPMFSFSRLHGVDPILGVEMASTGEVGCLGADMYEALLQSLIATGFKLPKRGVLLSLGPLEEKFSFADEARTIAEELLLPIFATPGTAEMLNELAIPCTSVEKTKSYEGSAIELLDRGVVDLVINVPREYDSQGRPDGFAIRRCAVEAGVPLFTDLQLARALVEALRVRRSAGAGVRSWNEYLVPSKSSSGLLYWLPVP